MKVYLDNCCYCRPFDDMKQPTIKAEAMAVGNAIRFCKNAKIKIVGSLVVASEIEDIRVADLRGAVNEFYSSSIDGEILLNADDFAKAQTLQASGNLGVADSQHLAAAEAVGATYLLTTDKDFIKKVARNNLSKVKVINPTKFLPEVKKWLR